PDTGPNAFTLILSVDDDGTGESTVIEFNEENNTYEIPVILGVTPTVNPHAASLELCDSDNNQMEEFDLTEIGNQMLGLQTEILIRYYTNEADAIAGNANNIGNPDAFNSGDQIIFVRMEDVVGCFIIAQFELKVLLAEEIPHEIPNLEYCSDSHVLTGISFDLTENEDAILAGANPADYTITYHLSQENAVSGINAIPNETDYENIASPETIWVRMMDVEGCVLYASFQLIAIPAGEIEHEIPVLENCSPDQTLTGIPTDLTENEEFILNGNDPTQFTITYHLNQEDAINGNGAIADPENYPNISAPQTVWVRITSLQGCVQYGSFELIYHAAPIANDALYEECSMHGPAVFHLENLNELVVADVNALNFTYYLNETDAENQINPLPNPYTPPTQSSWIVVRVENEFGCFTLVNVLLETIINTTIIEETYFECDDPYELNDGFTPFDLTQMNDQINLQLDLTQTIISYHLTMEEAALGNNAIPNPTNYINNSNPQTIYARALDANGNCGGVAKFTIEVLPVPEFELPEFLAFCNYDDKEFEFLRPFETYNWYDSHENLISNSAQVSFPSEGIY